MTARALVLLSDHDTDAPLLTGVATVSKDDAWDHGAYAIGVQRAQQGALWVDRPYATGNPAVAWMQGKIARVAAAGGYCQILNELNLALEGWHGGPGIYEYFYQQVETDRTLYAPPSPGVDGWQAWVGKAARYGVHAYGSFDQMRSVVAWYLDTFDSDVFVTECNPGAGNTFDLNTWAEGELRPFLAWCDAEPRVKMVAYFAWRWDQSPHLPSSVDARGTKVVDVLQEVGVPGNPLPDLCPFALWTPLTRNFDTDGAAPKVVVVHGTSGLGDPYGYWNRVADPSEAASADFWISKAGEIRQYVKLSQTSWSNGPIYHPDLTVPFLRWLVEYKRTHPGVTGNTWTVSVEFEKEKGNAEGPTLPQMDAGRRLFKWLSDTFGIPMDRNHFLEHRQFDSVTRAHCPGSFPWAAMLWAEASNNAPRVTALRDKLWVLKDEAWSLGRQQLGDAVKLAVQADKGEIPWSEVKV